VIWAETFFQRIERAGADIAEYHANRREYKNGQGCVLVTVAARNVDGPHDRGLRKLGVTDRQGAFLIFLAQYALQIGCYGSGRVTTTAPRN
jgi:hypothetical protein